MDKKTLNAMFDSLLHIGNKCNYWNPRMKPYIYGSVNGIHVINLLETAKKLEEVKVQLRSLASEGKKILFVATKLQSRDIFAKLASETGHYYVTEKWVPGLLTNFKTVKKRIATYLKLLRDSETGAFNVLTKKETAAKMLELEKLDRAFKGLKHMKKTPEVLFVVDGVYERQAVKEGKTLKMNTFAILNTNGDDSILTNIIPANTNSVKSIEFLAHALKEALLNVKVIPKKQPVKSIHTDSSESKKDVPQEKDVEDKGGKAVSKVKDDKETKPKAPKKDVAPKIEAKKTEKKAPAKKASVKKEEVSEEK